MRRDLIAARDKNGIYLAKENYDSMTTQIQQQLDSIRTLEEKISVMRNECFKVGGPGSVEGRSDLHGACWSLWQLW